MSKKYCMKTNGVEADNKYDYFIRASVGEIDRIYNQRNYAL